MAEKILKRLDLIRNGLIIFVAYITGILIGNAITSGLNFWATLFGIVSVIFIFEIIGIPLIWGTMHGIKDHVKRDDNEYGYPIITDTDTSILGMDFIHEGTYMVIEDKNGADVGLFKVIGKKDNPYIIKLEILKITTSDFTKLTNNSFEVVPSNILSRSAITAIIYTFKMPDMLIWTSFDSLFDYSFISCMDYPAGEIRYMDGRCAWITSDEDSAYIMYRNLKKHLGKEDYTDHSLKDETVKLVAYRKK